MPFPCKSASILRYLSKFHNAVLILILFPQDKSHKLVIFKVGCLSVLAIDHNIPVLKCSNHIPYVFTNIYHFRIQGNYFWRGT